MAKVLKIRSLCIFPQYLQKKLGSEVDFLPVDKCESFQQFYNISLSNIVVYNIVARHAQITQNNKFAIYLQYPKDNMKDEVDFCLQINIKGFFEMMLSF